ncbi:MAG TPA: hypothetical protein DC047_05435 [Blastocatellia bacterium]|nr:hypothetical protein [Blastocatellia bacterium]
MDTPLDHEVFSKNLETTFRISIDDTNSIDAELSNVTELQLSPGQERFSVVFRGPKEPLLGQGTYSFRHEQMGQFVLFIVPMRQDDDGTSYEAVFNRLRKGD